VADPEVRHPRAAALGGDLASVEAEAERTSGPPRRNIRATALLLAVMGISLYLLFPTFVALAGSLPRLREISPWWFPAMILLEAGSLFSFWVVQRLAFRIRRWGPVVLSGLAANGFSKMLPAGGAAGAAIQYRMLTRVGVDRDQVVTGATASNLLAFAVLLTMPVLAVPAILIRGRQVDQSLEHALLVGAVVFGVLFVIGVVLVRSERALDAVGRALQWVRNKVRRSSPPSDDVPDRLRAQRDLILRTLGRRWWEALLGSIGRWALDYAALLAALAAVGARPAASLVLLSYVAAQVLTLIPVTPGGLGFVEAGLTGTLVLAGVSGGDAVLATLAYRLVSFWLPIPAGLAGLVAFRARYGAA
jgi:putative heme transporter